MEMHPLVVVVDDDECVCRAMERLLHTVGYRVRTFTSPREYLAERESLEPSCIVIDIKMPELDGLSMLAESRTTGFEVPAVFVTGSTDVHAAVGAMKAGAVDLLEKPLDDSTLLTAVHAAIEWGEQQRAEWRDLGELWRALDGLTAREAQVCALVSSGRLNKQIAARIGTTEKTVKVHRARVMAKLGVRSVAELVRIVDRVLSRDTPPNIVTDDKQVLTAPRALDIMRSTLELGQADPVPTHIRASKQRNSNSVTVS